MGIKYLVNRNFFMKWSRKMAYVLGYIYADGNLEDSSKNRGLYLRISSIDLITIERIRSWMKSQHTIRKEKSYWKNGKDKYLLRIGDKNIYDSLIKIGLYPKKSLSITVPQIPLKYKLDFIRGYFDGDGCVYPYIVTKDKIKYARKLSVIFTSGSRMFLEQLSEILSEAINLKKAKPSKNTRSFQLRYSTNDSLSFFEALYKNTKKGEYLERKYQKFKYFLRIRNKKTQWRSW